MARIPAEVVERLKAEVSVQRLAEARGVELKRHGADLIGRCPFHDDRTPSLVITPAKNLWHCLGACQVGGTVIDWVMKAEGNSQTWINSKPVDHGAIVAELLNAIGAYDAFNPAFAQYGLSVEVSHAEYVSTMNPRKTGLCSTAASSVPLSATLDLTLRRKS
jgi:CHC2 zinc finger